MQSSTHAVRRQTVCDGDGQGNGGRAASRQRKVRIQSRFVAICLRARTIRGRSAARRVPNGGDESSSTRQRADQPHCIEANAGDYRKMAGRAEERCIIVLRGRIVDSAAPT
jgi:hypothetical protein